MKTKVYNKYNYYRNTYAFFKEVNPKDLPFTVWHYISKSGSSYYYTNAGVYRLSNHWGRAAKCRWVLESAGELYASKGRVKIGYIEWTGFYENSESMKSYFVKVNYKLATVTYDHKSRDISAQATYRTAKDTLKIIKKVKKILHTDSWSKYYEYSDIEVLRRAIITDLIS